MRANTSRRESTYLDRDRQSDDRGDRRDNRSPSVRHTDSILSPSSQLDVASTSSPTKDHPAKGRQLEALNYLQIIRY